MKTFIITLDVAGEMKTHHHIGHKKTNSSRKFMAMGIIALFVIVAIAAIAMLNNKNAIPGNKPSTESNPTIATVNGVLITQNQIDSLYIRLPTEYRIPTAKAILLNRTIDELLLLEEAKKQGVSVSDSAVDEQFQVALAAQGLTEAQVAQSLAQFNMTIPAMKAELKKQLTIFNLINKTIISQTTVSDDEIQNYYLAVTGSNDSNLTLTNATREQIKSAVLEEKIGQAALTLIGNLRSRAVIERIREP
ncbi:MAG: SurA N-terminal domain-containing protein [Nanoarchaeota archaeon]